MKLLPLGTVIKINNHKVCVIGYGSVEKETVSNIGYFVVSYPLGFTNIDKVFFVPEDASKYEVLAEGYKTKSSESLLNVMGESFETISNTPEDALLAFNQEFKSISKKEAQ